MMFPTGYRTRVVSLDQLFVEHEGDKMHPEFRRRLRAWLIAQEGRVGIGDGWRAGGAQPDRPGFAPEGRSFHQSQPFRSGEAWYAGVDLVVAVPGSTHRAPTWSEVPVQGSQDALRWGVHANVGRPPRGEPWHLQPIELDGWAGWWNAGRPDPQPNYPLPTDEDDDDMEYLANPQRLVDTRESGGVIQPGQPRRVEVPGTAAHVVLTAIAPSGRFTGPGWVKIAGGATEPATAILNVDGGELTANGSAPVGCPSRSMTIWVQHPAHVTIDLYAVKR